MFVYVQVTSYTGYFMTNYETPCRIYTYELHKKRTDKTLIYIVSNIKECKKILLQKINMKQWTDKYVD